jgi:glutamate N-acetyltransferase/amino-acid N-acetyltransferase
LDKIKAAVPDLIRALKSDGFTGFAEAIMTTDTIPKGVSETDQIDSKSYTVTGVAKGAGMIRPDMATMLCFVATDIGVPSDVLGRALSEAADRSFNRITVDGDTSTNDTIIVMANGASQASIKTHTHRENFQTVLDRVLLQLAKMLVKDGEGATKCVEVAVKGAFNKTDAKSVAYTVANSNLVKTALFGEDANWGRIIAAIGRSGVTVNPNLIDIYFDDVMMVKNGAGCGEAAETEATKVLKHSEFTINIGLNMGDAAFSVFTCDFSIDYVKINANYRS